ncbi:MAG: hypothetical protein PHW50_03300, partial [Patescibacteria group bacterium]|nr:hypothetical protein [Patescibacteria group bacterium]
MPNEPIDPNQNKPMQPVGTPPAKPSFNGPLKPGEQETYIERIKKITQRIKKRVKKPTSSLAETEEPNEEIEGQDQEEPQEPKEKQEQQKEPEERPEGEKIKDEIKPENETPEQPSAKQPETPKDKMPKSGTTPSVGATPPATGAAGAGETVAAGTGGVSGATAGAGAAASAEVAGAGAAASAGAGATAAAPILPYILIGLAIILGVAAIIILIVLIFSVLKGAGRSTPQYPDYTKAEDAGAAGTVLAASQTQDASLIAKAAGTETQEASKKIESDDNSQQATKYFWEIAEAKAQNNDLTESAQKQINKLETNASVLANSVPSQKSYVKEKILENKKILSTLTNPSNPTDINEAKKQVDKVVTSYEKVLSSDKTILQINPFDVEMIKTGQVDKRIILALKKIVDFSLSQTGENAERYSLFRVGKIYKADPYDKRETPLEEEEEFVSAHHFGQAIDINIVGKLKCTQNYWYKKKTSWHPCYVYYQGGGPQAMQVQENKNYAALTVPLALLSATESLGPLDINNTRNFYELFQSLGSQTIREEMGIDENYWDENTPFTPEKILASYLAQKTNLPISAISALIKTGDTKSLDRGIIEEQLKLPSGSLQGSNWNEIFTNTYKSYLSQTLGLQGIEINDFNSSQELGQALIKKSFYTQTDENQIFSTVTRSNVFYQNLWQLSAEEMALALQKKDLTYLTNLIGDKFKDGFMNQENPQYQTNWLGLPKGDLSDPKYKIAAGRYILAMIFNLEDQEKAFTSNDYFFKNAPYSPSVGFDICPGIAGEQTCPTYEIFNDPNNFFQKVGEALI